jgi:hypothetical protein
VHFAAFNKKPEVAALLLAHPACDPFVLDRKQGRTPAEDPPAEDTSDDAIRAAVVAAQEAVPLRGVPTVAMTPQTSHFTLVTSSLVRTLQKTGKILNFSIRISVRWITPTIHPPRAPHNQRPPLCAPLRPARVPLAPRARPSCPSCAPSTLLDLLTRGTPSMLGGSHD